MTEDQVHQLAEMNRIRIAPAHMPGVVRNLGTLHDQIALLFAEPLDPLVEPGPVFRA